MILDGRSYDRTGTVHTLRYIQIVDIVLSTADCYYDVVIVDLSIMSLWPWICENTLHIHVPHSFQLICYGSTCIYGIDRSTCRPKSSVHVCTYMYIHVCIIQQLDYTCNQ